MKNDSLITPPQTITGTDLDPNFTAEVRKKCGTEFNACLQCRTCSGGCPFSQAMDIMPNGIIRLLQLGLRKEALESTTIWICVGCHTCSIQCPMAIDIASVMDSLRQIALEEDAVVKEPDILNFHREVLHSIEHYGRTHKLEIMLRYKLIRRDWFSDMDVGMKMLTKRKLDLTPSRVKEIGDVKKLFKQNWRK